MGRVSFTWVSIMCMLQWLPAHGINEVCYSLNDESYPYACAAETSQEVDRCRLLCIFCTSPDLKFSTDDETKTICESDWSYDEGIVVSIVSTAFLNISTIHGQYWKDDGSEPYWNISKAVQYLFQYMPLRDQQLLFPGSGGFSFETMTWILDNIRLSFTARYNWPAAKAVPWNVFLENVIPYAAIDERRDVSFNWRSRFFQLLFANVSSYATLYDGAKSVANLMPYLQMEGALGLNSDTNYGTYVAWKSESSPAILSPHQTIQFGGSCTGTGITMLAAFRSVGIPARLAGCSNEYVDGAMLDDDHHWIEFWDDSVAGPFAGTPEWHTKEGTSKGNAGGPWDSPSGPMNGCLKYSVPGSDQATLWATSWSSPIFLPLQWNYNTWSQSVGFVGGINRCGAYCTAWGCGVNQTDFWTQDQCGPGNGNGNAIESMYIY
jgi:hypothetical protein